MSEPIKTAREALAEILVLLKNLDDRLETLELQNLKQRLERAEQLAIIRGEETDKQLLRLAQVVADLSTG